MFCIKCGNKLGDEDVFCCRCGHRVVRIPQTDHAEDTYAEDTHAENVHIENTIEPAEQGIQLEYAKQPEPAEGAGKEAETKQSEEAGKEAEAEHLGQSERKADTEQPESDKAVREEKATRHGCLGEILQNLILVAFVFAGVIAVVWGVSDVLDIDILRYIPFFRNNTYYASPEFPDNILIYTDGVSEDGEEMAYPTLVTDTNELIQNIEQLSVAENGTIAYKTYDGAEVEVRGKYDTAISGSADSFILSGSGRKIVYSSEALGTWVQNLANGDTQDLTGAGYINDISYNGNTISTDTGYCRNGDNDFGSGKEILAVSSDGKYIYYARELPEGIEFCVDIDGEENSILTSDEYPAICAYSNDYKEILFSCGSSIYYYSAEDGSGLEAQYIDSMGEGELFPVYGMAGKIREQRSIKDNVYCIADDTDMFSYSLVKLDDDLTFSTLLSGLSYKYDICRSRDGKKFWCIANGELAYCDASDNPENYGVLYSNIFVEEGDAGSTDILAASRDGSVAYVVDEEGILWKFTPDTLNDPVEICQDAYQVYYGSDDEFYVIKDGDGVFSDRYRGLCQISEDDTVERSVEGGVAGMYCTKKNQYFLAEEADSPDNYLLWYKDGDMWSILSRDCGDYTEPVYWGGANNYYDGDF